MRSYYRWRAEGYDRATVYEIEHHREAIQLADIQPGEDVLEVACGTGRATVELADRLGPAGKLVALDISEAMLGHARRKAEERGLIDRIDFRLGNARDLPLPGSSFDLLYNSYMFDLIAEEDFPPILEEFKRVLRPGGRLVLLNMSKDSLRRTPYEMAYSAVRLFPCRPVSMANHVDAAGFTNVQRAYRKSFLGPVLLPFGAEILTSSKPALG